MALQYVSRVPIYVSDQDKALDFYTNKLGFTKGEDAQVGGGMRWLEVLTPQGTAVLTLMASNGMEHMLGKHTGLAFYSDNVRGTCEELKAKGVTIAEEPRDEPWGVEAQFTDMDGNGFEIVGG